MKILNKIITAVCLMAASVPVLSGKDYIVNAGSISLAVAAPEGGKLDFLYFGP